MKPTTHLASSIRRAIGLSAGALLLAGVPISGMAAINCSSSALSIPANVDGVYLNLATGATGTSGSGVGGWDINLYMTGASALYFFWPSTPANSAGGVSTATIYDALSAGATIGPAQTYIVNSGGGGPAPFANWQTAQTGKYLGVRFYNESTSAINYAWAQMDTGASGGFPATINKYCYDNTGAAITAGNTGGGGGPATPSLGLATSGSPSQVGANVTFTSTLSGNAALTGVGNITFCVDAPATNATCGGTTPLCTVSATAPSATCNTSALAVGTHVVSAYFSGDANNTAATSSNLTQVVSSLPASDIVCSSSALSIPANVDGVYLNLVTGATGTSGSGVGGWDINLYMTGASALYFFWPSTPANSAGGVSTATIYDALSAGATIGPAQTYIVNSGGGGPAPFANWQTAQTGKYLGLRFYNESTSAINYAWAQMDTGASGGFPATINKYCYNKAGAAITAGDTGGGGGPATPSLGLATSGSPSLVGTSVTFTSTLSGNAALTGSGNITFCADAPTTNATCGGTAPLCTVAANATTATCATSALTVGTHSITAYFSGDANNNAATSPAVAQVVSTPPPPPTLAIYDGTDFAQYGQVVDYTVTLTNNVPSAANGISVMFALSSGFDGAAAQWACAGAGATCTQDPMNPLHYTVNLPASGSVTWLVGVPVRADATENDVVFSVSATGATTVADVNTLVIFRDGFDVDFTPPVK